MDGFALINYDMPREGNLCMYKLKKAILKENMKQTKQPVSS